MTQAQRILAILNDGEWHRSDLIFKATGCTRVAARIQDLEARGHTIDARRSDFYGFKEYRLRPKVETAPPPPVAQGTQAQLLTVRPKITH